MVGLADVPPHLFESVGLPAVVLLNELVLVRYLNRNAPLGVPQQPHVIDQMLSYLLLMLEVVVVFLFLEKPESIDVFVELLYFANGVDELAALVHDVEFGRFIINSAHLSFCDI